MTNHRQYYWLCAKDEQGKPYLVFGGTDETEARHKGLEILGGLDFEIKRYPTRDLGTASAYYRGKRLDETHSLRDAKQRLGHDRSLNRLRKQKLQRGLG